MSKRFALLVLVAAHLFIFADVGFAAERSVESIREAWRNSLKGVQTFGLAVQELDADAKACGIDRMALADGVKSGIKDPALSITLDNLQLFNLFVDLITVFAADRCTSIVSLRASAFVGPSYAPLIAAEITPWSQRAILISAKESHLRAIADELAKQAVEFAKVWREQQSR
jgi:hypothetical protein